jgi:hypothetical protein
MESSLLESGSLPSVGHFALGKGFVECRTRQRVLGKILIVKGVFIECLLSGTRQKLCRVPSWLALGKEK